MADGLEKFHETKLKAVLAKLNELGFKQPKKISLKQNEFSFLVKNNLGIQFEFKFDKTSTLSIDLEPTFSWIRSIVQVVFALVISMQIIAVTQISIDGLIIPILSPLVIPMIFFVLIVLNIIRDKMYKRKHAISLMDLTAEFQSFA